MRIPGGRQAFLTAAVLLLLTVGAGAAEKLSTAGMALTDVAVNPAAVATSGVSRTIDLSGDIPTATFVTAHLPDGKHLQRSNLGYWLPWDGDVDSLIDNRLPLNGDGTVTFKVVKEDLSDKMFPIAVTLAYTVGEQVKFGVFQILPQ